MNRSRTRLGRLGLLPDGGRPGCPGCGDLLEFITDGQGRTIERCDCGYRGYVVLRATAAKPVLPE